MSRGFNNETTVTGPLADQGASRCWMETVRGEKYDTDPPYLGEQFRLEGFISVAQCRDGGYVTFPVYAVRLPTGAVQPMMIHEYYPYDRGDVAREMLFTEEEAQEFLNEKQRKGR